MNGGATISLLSLISSFNSILAARLIVVVGEDFWLQCPLLYDTKSVWWVKDKMTLLSINGEEPSLHTSVLWPESHDKYRFELRELSSRMIVVNASFDDAADYRCVVDLHRSGQVHSVAVIGNLACRWFAVGHDDSFGDKDYDRGAAADPSPGNSFVSRPDGSRFPGNFNRAIRCSVETSDNFDEDAEVTFRLFEFGDGEDFPRAESYRDRGMPPVDYYSKRSQWSQRQRRFYHRALTQVGRRFEANPRVVGAVFLWRRSDGGNGTKRWRVQVEVSSVAKGAETNASPSARVRQILDVELEEEPVEALDAKNEELPEIRGSNSQLTVRGGESGVSQRVVASSFGFNSGNVTVRKIGIVEDGREIVEDDGGVRSDKGVVGGDNNVGADLMGRVRVWIEEAISLGMVIVVLVVAALIAMTVVFFYPCRGGKVADNTAMKKYSVSAKNSPPDVWL